MIVYKGFEREDVTSDLSIHGTRGFLLAVSPVALVGLVVCILDRCIKWEAAAGVGLRRLGMSMECVWGAVVQRCEGTAGWICSVDVGVDV